MLQVLVDLKQNPFYSHGQRRKLQCSTIEVIDLDNHSLPTQQLQSITADHTVNETARRVLEASVNSGIVNKNGNLDKDVIYFDSCDRHGGHTVSVPHVQEEFTNPHVAIHSYLKDKNNQKLVSTTQHELQYNAKPNTFDVLESKRIKAWDSFDVSNEFQESPTLELQNNVTVEEILNTKLTQNSSTPVAATKDVEHCETLDCSLNWLGRVPSPFSLNSSYHCPSEIDAMVFSEESWMEAAYGRNSTPCSPTEFLFDIETPDLPEKALSQPHTLSQTLPSSGEASFISSLQCGPAEPISTTAWEYSGIGSVFSIYSPATSPVPSCSFSRASSKSHLSCIESVSLGCLPPSQWMRTDMDGEMDALEPDTQRGQDISLVQFKKLQHLIGRPEQDEVMLVHSLFVVDYVSTSERLLMSFLCGVWC